MAQAKSGDTVRVHYTGKLDDGTVFDTSLSREPLELTIGNHDLIPAFEQAIVGMEPGESKSINVSPDEAFGPYREDMVVDLDRTRFPEDMDLQVGRRLEMTENGSRTITVTITDVSETTVTVDANHPLAGEELTFDIQLVEIV